MPIAQHTVRRPPAQVFDTLVTPESYPHWLLGAQAIRAVDDGWPEVGTAFHHRVGVVGPLTIPDHTTVREIDPPHRLVLEVRARPLGRGRVTFTLTSDAGPAGPGTLVELSETPIGMLAPAEPVLAPLIRWRNRRSLRRLAAYLDQTP